MGSSINPHNKKTYVVCPRRSDFTRWCRHHNVPSQEMFHNTIHVNSPLQLLGRRIRPQDDIDYYNILGFHDGVYEEILKELKMRSHGHEFP